MPPTTTRELQAQIQLLAAVVRCILAELPAESASSVCTALEDALIAQQPLSDDLDAATARLVLALVGPFRATSEATCSVGRLCVVAERASR